MNINIFYFLNNLAGQNSFFDSLVVFFADLFALLIIGFVCLYLVLNYGKSSRENIKKALFIFGPAIFSYFVTYALKIFFAMPRPFVALENINLLINEKGMDSFPSGHATFFSALATSVYFYNKKLGAVLWFGVLLIGLARIIGGAHFPIDILAGLMIGIIISYTIAKLIKKD